MVISKALESAIERNRDRCSGNQYVVFVVCREQVIVHIHANQDIANGVFLDAMKAIERYPNGTIQSVVKTTFPAWLSRDMIARSVKGNHDLPIMFA